jgi:ribosomal protein S18 acetylase RimI-like enzyme
MREAVSLRVTRDDDLPFLFTLYCDVRSPEVNAWGWPSSQRDSFLRMQFEAQQRSYRAAYPESTDQIVYSGDLPIGRRLIASLREKMHLIDIALVAGYRNRGIGAWLIRQLIDDCEAKGAPLYLQVLSGNPAQRLYQRLGFRETESNSMYIQMRLMPGAGCPT